MTAQPLLKDPAKPLRNIHDLAPAERAQLMRDSWAQNSRFQKEFGTDFTEFGTGDCSLALRQEVLRQLAVKGIVKDIKLEELHNHIPQELKDYGINDGVNKLSTFLYDTDEQFTETYHRFIKEAVAKQFPYPFYFQATPTVRIHCPNGKNVHHYPRYHSDIGYGHPPQEINLWLPLTEPGSPQAHGFHLMNVMDSRKTLEPFNYDFEPFINRAVNEPDYNQQLHKVAKPVTTPFGKCFAFDSRCIHSGDPLLNHTRASIDIRIIPVADFNSLPVEYQGTGRRRIRYVPGVCYHERDSSRL